MGKTWLLVDIGNTRVKWGRAKNGRLVAGTPFPSEGAALCDHLDRHWRALGAPDAVYVSNVIGAEAAGRLADWIARHWSGVPVRFARSEAQGHGVINGYERPEQLGVDRWVGLIALRRDYPLPACVADCGTALTFDVLDADGRHLGGLIAPGPALMKRALVQETRGVRGGDGRVPEFLGRDTAAGVASGILRACAGLVEKSVREAAEYLGRSPTLVLSGGDGEAVGQCLGVPYRLEPDLVLRGLFTIAEDGS
jgi:type III pantothenate kinase